MPRKNEAERLAELTRIERPLWARPGIVLAGMDEVGRGPLAGPVVAACVVLPPEPLIEYVNDSKKLSERRRELLDAQIRAQALDISLGWVGPDVIDQINILQATKQAFVKAFQGMSAKVTDVLIDAVQGLDIPAEQHVFIHGDALSYLIAAASIVAKVARDSYMCQMHEQYPQYGFCRNKGYGTKEHMDALRAYGPCPLHRRSFIGRII